MPTAINNNDIQLNDCWNRIGVWGREQPRCEKLAVHTHCRNCEVYAEAGRKILERRIPEEYEDHWANIYSQEKKEQLAGTESMTIFRLGTEWIALSTTIIKEITETQPIHHIPHRHSPMLRGLVNIRGQLKICFSLGNLLGIEKSNATQTNSSTNSTRVYNRLLNITNGTDDFAFLVSEVKDTFRIDPEMLQTPPATISKAKGTYTRGIIPWQGHDVACLDSDLLFYSLGNSLS